MSIRVSFLQSVLSSSGITLVNKCAYTTLESFEHFSVVNVDQGMVNCLAGHHELKLAVGPVLNP